MRVLTASVAALVVTSMADIPAASATVPAPACPASAVTEAEAVTAARSCGGRVEVARATTETATAVALPSGAVEVTVSAAPVRVRRTDGAWAPVDLTLVRHSDGTLAPQAAPSSLVISGPQSGDGTHELAAVGVGAHRVAVSWTGALRNPVLDGSRATYPEARPGVDLVVQATRTGLETFFVVKSPAAAAAITGLQLPVTGAKVASHRTDAAGNTTLLDAAGTPLVSLPAPEMWDARVDALTGAPAVVRKVTATVSHKAAVAKSRRLADAAGATMTLGAAGDFFRDPATRYPVVVDPQINPLYTSFDTYVRQNDTVDRSGANDLQLGIVSGNIARSFVSWDTSKLAGKQITGASVYFWNFWSGTCSATGWDIWTTGAATAATRWSTQPAWLNKEASSTGTKGGSGCTDGWVSVSGTSFFQRAATAKASRGYMGIRAGSESNGDSFKQFRSRNADSSAQVPYAVVTYNSYPVVGARSTTPATSCATGTARPFINTATPTLKTTLSDPDGGTVKASVEWWVTGGSKVGGTTTAALASGATAAVTVPAGAMANGSTYSWRVAANDGAVSSAWSPYCEFTIDTTAPAVAPTVTSSQYPAGATAGKPGTAGTFTFGAAGVTDIARYSYRLGSGTATSVAAATVGGTATATITPTAAGSTTLSVTAYDRAGNASPVKTYTFTVGAGPAVTVFPVVSNRGMVNDTALEPVAAPCVTGSGRPVVATLTPQMWATFTHATDTTVNADVEYGTLDGTSLGIERVDAQPITDRVSAWVPQEILDNGSSYRWRIRARSADGALGAFSSWCEFTVQAASVRSAENGEDYDEYVPASDTIPDVDDPTEEVGTDETVPDTENEPPYQPSPDTGDVAVETDDDETDLPDGAFTTEADPATPVDEAPPAGAQPVTDDPGDSVDPTCPFDATALPQDGSTVPAPADVADGQYACEAADQPQALTAGDDDATALPDALVDSEVGPDTPEDFAAAHSGTVSAAAAVSASSVGQLKNTALPDACRYAPRRKWMVGRYDACYADSDYVDAITVSNGGLRWDGRVTYTYWRYARQASKKGTWDYHVYLQATSVTGTRISNLRVSLLSAWCSYSRCRAVPLASNAGIGSVGKKAQFTATFTPSLAGAPGKRLQDTGRITLVFARPGDVAPAVRVVESNWVRCDQALKGSSSIGCVVPNYIPSLYYSRHGRYPDLANHIWWAQQSGLPGKPGGILVGQAGSEQALRRLYDATKRKKNGSKACPSGYRARVGAPSSTSCDEYPFRSTYQGAYTADPNHNRPRTFSFCHIPGLATRTGPVGYSRCFINATQNSRGGNWVGRLYSADDGGQRLLDGDRYYVRIG